MKCPKSKKLIYLYDELSEGDRSKLDLHLQNCESCRKILAESKNNLQFLQTAMTPPYLADDRLTDSIMNEVLKAKRKKDGVRKDSFLLFDSLYVRLGFATLSIFLVATFFLEYNQESTNTVIANRNEIVSDRENSRTIRLNSAAFYNPANRDSLTRSPSLLSLVDCIKACDQSSLSDVCEDCRNKFEKLRTTL